MTTVELTIERSSDETNDWRELVVEVRGTVTRERPAILFGPMMGPADGGEIEIDSVTCATEEVELTQAELARAEGMLAMQAAADSAEARYTRADWERSSRIDGF